MINSAQFVILGLAPSVEVALVPQAATVSDV